MCYRLKKNLNCYSQDVIKQKKILFELHMK